MGICKTIASPLHEESEPKLEMDKASDLYKHTLKSYHYEAMIDKLNNIDGKFKNFDKEFESVGRLIGFLLRALWRKYEKGLIIHDTKYVGGKPEQYLEVQSAGKFDQGKNNGEWGVYTDLVYDTYLKKWTKAYQGTFHEFFHNIDYLVKGENRNSSSETYKTFKGERFGKTIIRDVIRLKEDGKLDEIENDKGLDRYAKAYLYDIIGGVLHNNKYGCHGCASIGSGCGIDIFCDEFTTQGWGHEPEYWLSFGVLLYWMPEKKRKELFKDKNRIIEILRRDRKTLEFEQDKEKIKNIFKELANLAIIRFEKYERNFNSHYGEEKCFISCANIAALAATTITKDFKSDDREIDFFYDKDKNWAKEYQKGEAYAKIEKICKYFPDLIAFETFANMASTAVANINAFRVMKKYLPKSYKMFIEILECMVCDICQK